MNELAFIFGTWIGYKIFCLLLFDQKVSNHRLTFKYGDKHE